MPSPRVLKLADQIKVIAAQMLERRIKDPRLGFVTVTDVRLTGDSREATVFYTVLGTDADRAGTAAALASATGVIRTQVGKQLGLRYTPSLAFVLDAVPETAQRFEDLLAQARSGDAEVAARAAQASYAGEADPYRKPREDDELDEDDDLDGQDDLDEDGLPEAGSDEPDADAPAAEVPDDDTDAR
ncbi:ribosome-binding factor A [Auraticoccus monumenti]|uniref:Ribosome-binding factor A n=1 Tax=Auraticoccus monumenti TaxID=675864 RepID=A0A1G7DA29_9ACTN|nr:ribosome-binding factor A [Auraticoccus monumenti]